MDLYSGDVYWLIKDGQLFHYPPLQNNLDVDVLIIGAGISGALAAYYLLNQGLRVAIIDKREVASGSTCASTSLLQYETDVHLADLVESLGKEKAFTIFRLCRDAIYKLEKICGEIKSNATFEILQSVYIASKKSHVRVLEKELEYRKEAGFEIELLKEKALEKSLKLSAPAALISKDGGQIDLYRFTQELLHYLLVNGVMIFEKTEAVEIKYNEEGISVITGDNQYISSKYLIYANGYEAQNYLKHQYGKLHSTYVVISKPMSCKPFDYLIWETARPYLYMRTTADNRIIIGGMDEPFYNPEKRDSLLDKKSKQLVKAFNDIFPDVTFIADYSWTGTFAESKDGLPFIGKHPDHPHSYFALGYGGNGITFSVIAAEIIRDQILRKENQHRHLFSFDR